VGFPAENAESLLPPHRRHPAPNHSGGFSIDTIGLAGLVAGGVLIGFHAAYYALVFHMSKELPRVVRGPVNEEVTILIPTHNEEVTILSKLENLLNQSYPKDLMKVLVVDSESTDRTRELVSAFQKDHPELNVRIIAEPTRRGKPAAVANALEQCETDLVIITDADIGLYNESVRIILENFSDPQIGAVTGRQTIPNLEYSRNTRIEYTYRSIFDIIRIGESNLDSTPVFAGEFMAFRRTAAKKLNPDSVADDTALALGIRANGKRTVVDPASFFVEPSPSSNRARLEQKKRRGMGIIQALMNNHNMLFRPSYGLFGAVVLPAEIFMHVFSPLLFFASIGLVGYFVITAVGFHSLIEAFIFASFIFALLLLISFRGGRHVPGVLLFAASFITAQVYLLYGLILLILQQVSSTARSKMIKWERITETRAGSNMRF
jgi:cellulose synthase/poly-beta-1,6-N-acetylglucosamine synthase-like glycosyltransferase